MDGKVLTKETKDAIVKVGDESLKLKGVWEMADGPMIRITINFVDKFGDKHIPDTLDPDINKAANLALAGQYEEAGEKAGEVMDRLIDLEKVSDANEKLIFVDGMKMIVRLILWFVQKKKEENS